MDPKSDMCDTKNSTFWNFPTVENCRNARDWQNSILCLFMSIFQIKMRSVVLTF